VEQPPTDGFEGFQFFAHRRGPGPQVRRQVRHHLGVPLAVAGQQPVSLLAIGHPAAVQQQVGDSRHGRGHHADSVGGTGATDQVRHGAEAVRAGEAGATEFHHTDGAGIHGGSG